jgi:hypothetical protein
MNAATATTTAVISINVFVTEVELDPLGTGSRPDDTGPASELLLRTTRLLLSEHGYDGSYVSGLERRANVAPVQNQCAAS